MGKKRLVIPDIIKIGCTLIILFHHYQQLTGTYFVGSHFNFYGGRFYLGYAVEVFFLLSGWVMVPYIDRIKGDMSFGEFIGKRLIRLLPSMIVFTILYDIMLYVYVRFCNGTLRFPTEIDIFGSIVTALGLGSWGITKSYEINNVCWYVSVQILCYIIMYLLLYISKKAKIPAAVMLIIPMIAGSYRYNFMEYSVLPFFTRQIARGYIHFFGGLLLGMIFARFVKNTTVTPSTGNKVVAFFKKVIGSLGEAVLDIYLSQLSVLLLFFVISYRHNISLTNVKMMIIYGVVTFAFGYGYHVVIGKRINKWLFILLSIFQKKDKNKLLHL